MLDWFRSRPTPPVDTWFKAWTETRMLWLADQLGADRILKARVLRPAAEDFRGIDWRTDDGVRRLMGTLCGVIGIGPDEVELEILEDRRVVGDSDQHGALDAGRTIVRISRSRLTEFQGLVATLAHELAHAKLVGQGLLTAEADDHRIVADLATVFLGLGIFPANAALCELATQLGHREVRQHGYLPTHVLGYALALFAHARGEDVPEWGEDLRLDAAEPLRAGLKYLEKTGDTLFDRTSIAGRSRGSTPAAVTGLLREGSPSVRLATLWRIRKDGPAGSEQAEAVLSLLEDRDEAVRTEAAWVAGEHALAPDRAPGLLVDLLRSRAGTTRATAAWALGAFPEHAEETISRLIPVLEDPDDAVVVNAASSLGRFGFQAEEAIAPMFEALTRALIDCKPSVEQALARSLGEVIPDLNDRLDDYFAELDPELVPLARGAFELPVIPAHPDEQDDDPLWDEELDGDRP